MKTMLAASEELKFEDLHKLSYPVWCSYKFDGIRGRCLGPAITSRTDKPIPNLLIRATLTSLRYLDGELVTPGDFNDVQSAVMSVGGNPDFTYHVFDDLEFPNKPYSERYEILRNRVAKYDHPRVKFTAQIVCNSPAEVIALYEEVVALGEGYDGLIIRDPRAPYKSGRSTLIQGWMLKLKPWKDAEATIIGTEELLSNLDTSTKMKDNMVPMDTLGAFIVTWNGKVFNIGGGKGFTAERRKYWWNHRLDMIGKKVTFKYLNLSEDGIPRHPNLRGQRLDA